MFAELYGPLLQARNALTEVGCWRALRDDLIALSEDANIGPNSGFRAPSDYLVIVGGNGRAATRARLAAERRDDARRPAARPRTRQAPAAGRERGGVGRSWSGQRPGIASSRPV